MSSYPEIDKTLNAIRVRKLAGEQRLLKAQYFPQQFAETQRGIGLATLAELENVLETEDFEVEIHNELACQPHVATDTPFQHITMYMWPPGRPRYAADDCT